MMKPLWGGKYPSEGHPGDQACRSCRAIRAQAASLEGRRHLGQLRNGPAGREVDQVAWHHSVKLVRLCASARLRRRRVAASCRTH